MPTCQDTQTARNRTGLHPYWVLGTRYSVLGTCYSVLCTPPLHFRLLTVLVLSLFFCSDVSACSQCTLAILWNGFPGSIWWLGIGFVWYIALAVLCRVYQVKVRLILKSWFAIVHIVLLVIASWFLSFLLPLIALFLLFAAAGTLMIFIQSRRKEYRRGFVGWVVAVGAAACVAIVASAIFEAARARQMDLADKIHMWEGTILSRQWERQLKGIEPASIPQYRKLLNTMPTSFEAQRAAERLGRIGEPAVDVPIILTAAEACTSAGESAKYVRPGYAKPLQQLTRVTLNEYDPTEAWRKKIAAEWKM